jgi:nitroreductase
MMSIDGIDQDRIYQEVASAIKLAARAPSVHNSQPWSCLVSRDTIHLHADLSRWLPATDADRRDLMLSCGAMLHHLQVSLAAVGLQPKVHRFPNPVIEDHLAAFELNRAEAEDEAIRLASAISRRRTDRRPYKSWQLPDGYLRELVKRANDQGAVLRLISDPQRRAMLLDAIQAAATAQEETPGYQTELAMWSGRHGSDDGVPAANLLSSSSAHAEGERRFPEGDIQTRANERDGATLLVLGAASDDRLSQLRAGEAMSAVLLQATRMGLASCPLSQPLEVASTRRLLRDEVLGGTLSPQLVLRLGYPQPSPLPATPRRLVNEIIHYGRHRASHG